MKAILTVAAVALLVLAGQAVGGSNTGLPQEEPRDMGQVREKLAEVLTVVREAYEELLATVPEAAGDIQVGFAITPEGAVTDVIVTCSGEVESLHDRVVSVVEGLDFGVAATQKENIPVTAPIRLVPPE